MKRSINTENLIVVMAVALAVSLLASACGPGKSKTKIDKNNKIIVPNDGSSTTQTTIDAENQVLQAIQEKIAGTVAAPTDQTSPLVQTPEQVDAVKELANRISFVTLKETEEGHQLSVQITSKVDQKAFYVIFSEASYNNENRTITFSKNQSREILLANRLSETAVELPISAEITLSTGSDENLRIVTIKETDRVSNKTVSMNALVRSVSAKSEIKSTDENILKLKTKTIAVKTVQAYIADDSILHDGKLTLLDSKANRVTILVTNEDQTPMLDLKSKININQDLTPLSIVTDTEIANSSKINNDIYSVVLKAKSGEAIVMTDSLEVVFTNKTSKEESSITLSLKNVALQPTAAQETEEETGAAAIVEEETSEVAPRTKTKLDKENVSGKSATAKGTDAKALKASEINKSGTSNKVISGKNNGTAKQVSEAPVAANNSSIQKSAPASAKSLAKSGTETAKQRNSTPEAASKKAGTSNKAITTKKNETAVTAPYVYETLPAQVGPRIHTHRVSQ